MLPPLSPLPLPPGYTPSQAAQGSDRLVVGSSVVFLVIRLHALKETKSSSFIFIKSKKPIWICQKLFPCHVPAMQALPLSPPHHIPLSPAPTPASHHEPRWCPVPDASHVHSTSAIARDPSPPASRFSHAPAPPPSTLPCPTCTKRYHKGVPMASRGGSRVCTLIPLHQAVSV